MTLTEFFRILQPITLPLPIGAAAPAPATQK